MGHSYSTGVLAGLLTNETIGVIDLDIYSRIYQVVICGESRNLIYLTHLLNALNKMNLEFN